MHRPIATALATAILFTGSVAFACMHAMRDTKLAPKPTELQAVVAWNDGIEDLVLGLQYEGRDKVAYVVPVPVPPTEYKITDPELFQAFQQHVQLDRPVPVRSKGVSRQAKSLEPQAAASLVELPTQVVGPYEIHPLKASGAEGLIALNGWMKENGFNEVGAEQARYYVDRNWTFLAIKLDAAENAVSRIPPLHLRFSYPRAVFPLKLMSPPEQMKVRAYVVTAEPLSDESKKAATDRGFEVVRGSDYTGPESLSGLLPQLRTSGLDLSAQEGPKPLVSFAKSLGWLEAKPAPITVLYNEHFKGGGSWDEDLSIPPPPADAKLAGGQPQAAEDKPDDETGAKPSETTPRFESVSLDPGKAQSPAQEQEASESKFVSCATASGDPTAWMLLLVGFLGLRRRTVAPR